MKRRLALGVVLGAVWLLAGVGTAAAQDGVSVVEGNALKMALGYGDGEKRVPITLRGSPANLPALTVTVSEFVGGDGIKINRSVGIAVAGSKPASSLRIEGGARTAHLQLVFGAGGSDAGTYTGQVFVDSEQASLASITAAATAQASRPDVALAVLLLAGAVGWFLVHQIQKSRALREQERRASLVQAALVGVDIVLLPEAVQAQILRMRAALEERNAAVAGEVLTELDRTLFVGGLASFARVRLSPIQRAIDSQAQELTPSDSAAGRALIAAERNRLGSLAELAGSDLQAARRGAEQLAQLVNAADAQLGAVEAREGSVRSLTAHLEDDERWLERWTPPPDEAAKGVAEVEAASPVRRRRLPPAISTPAVRGGRWLKRRLWSAQAFLFYGGVLSLALISLVGLQVLYLGNPTFGAAGLTDWIALIAWGVAIQAGGTSTLGLLRSVTPQAGLTLIGTGRDGAEPGQDGQPGPGGGKDAKKDGP